MMLSVLILGVAVFAFTAHAQWQEPSASPPQGLPPGFVWLQGTSPALQTGSARLDGGVAAGYLTLTGDGTDAWIDAPSQGSLFVESNGNVQIRLDEDEATAPGISELRVVNGANTRILTLTESGDLSTSGFLQSTGNVRILVDSDANNSTTPGVFAVYGQLESDSTRTPDLLFSVTENGNLLLRNVSNVLQLNVDTDGDLFVRGEVRASGANGVISSTGVFSSPFDFHLRAGATPDRITVNATTGNVGIGTVPDATHRVDVAGKLNATELCIAGACQASWPSGGGAVDAVLRSDAPQSAARQVGGFHVTSGVFSDGATTDTANIVYDTSASPAWNALFIDSTGDVQIRVDSDDNELKAFKINNGANETVLNVSESGTLTLGTPGAAGAMNLQGGDISNVGMGIKAGGTSNLRLYGGGSLYPGLQVAPDGKVGINGMDPEASSEHLVVSGNTRTTGYVRAGAATPYTDFTPITGDVIGTRFCIAGVCRDTWPSAGGGGTVTSVGLSLPSPIFAVSGSPVTGSGTLTAAWNSQNPNLVLAGPASGTAAIPTFRNLVAADIPTIDAAKIASGVFADTLLSANVAFLNRTPQTFTGANTFASIGLSGLQASGVLQETVRKQDSIDRQTVLLQSNTNVSIQLDQNRNGSNEGTTSTTPAAFQIFGQLDSDTTSTPDLLFEVTEQGAMTLQNASGSALLRVLATTGEVGMGTAPVSGMRLTVGGRASVTGVPVGPGVLEGTLTVNSVSAAVDRTLFGVAVNGVQKFRVDAEGDVSVGYEQIISTTSCTVTSSVSAQTCDVSCPSGKRILSGGGHTTNPDAVLNIRGSYPSSNGTWVVRFQNPNAVSVSVTMYAICARLAP